MSHRAPRRAPRACVSQPQCMISNVARPGFRHEVRKDLVALHRRQMVERVRRRHPIFRLQRLVPEIAGEQHRVRGGNLEHRRRQDAPGRTGCEQHQRARLATRRQHLRQQSAERMTEQESAAAPSVSMNASRSVRIVQKTGRAQRARRACTFSMMTQSRRVHLDTPHASNGLRNESNAHGPQNAPWIITMGGRADCLQATGPAMSRKAAITFA